MHLQSGAHMRFAAVHDILVIESQENYSLVRLADGSRELVRRSLKAWMVLLPVKSFLQVHRTVVVNLAHVTGYRRTGPKAFFLQVAGLRRLVPVGRKKWVEVRRRLPGPRRG